MKLAELGLKTKPETKYFAGGYTAFSARDGELWFSSFYVKKSGMGDIISGYIQSKDQLTKLLAVKSIKDLMVVVQ